LGTVVKQLSVVGMVMTQQMSYEVSCSAVGGCVLHYHLDVGSRCG